MELQNLDIDKYINWYKGLTAIPELQKKYERLCLISFRLHTRYAINTNNTLSLSTSERLLSDAKALGKQIDKYVQLTPEWYKKKGIKPVFFIPSNTDWFYFQTTRESFFNTSKEQFEDLKERSSLPENQLLKNEMGKVNSEDFKFIDYFTMANPLILQGSKNSIIFDFANEVSIIDYCKWLDNRIKDIEAPNNTALPFLKWNLTGKDLSELIKALYLINAFDVRSENQITRAFATMTGEDLQRHSANISELSFSNDSTPLFTERLSKEIMSLKRKQLTAKKIKK